MLQVVTSLNQDFKHFDIILTYVKPLLYYNPEWEIGCSMFWATLLFINTSQILEYSIRYSREYFSNEKLDSHSTARSSCFYLWTSLHFVSLCKRLLLKVHPVHGRDDPVLSGKAISIWNTSERTNERSLFANERIEQWLVTSRGRSPSKLATKKTDKLTKTKEKDRERKR